MSQIAGTGDTTQGVAVDTATGAGQVFGSQGGPADLRNWPTAVQWFLFPPGPWLFLDGGELDLGMVRDSTLNATNDDAANLCAAS